MVVESKIPKEAEIQPTDFVIVGGTVATALRKVFLALFHRFLDGQIPKSYGLIAAVDNATPKVEFIAQLRSFCDGVITLYDEADWDVLADRIQIMALNVRSREGASDIEEACMVKTVVPSIFYFAISPALFVDVGQTPDRTGLKTDQTRLVFEKPMGHDVRRAEAVDDSILEPFEERQIYRIFKYIGKETVQNFMALHFANSIFESLWSNAYIDHVQILVAEKVGVESRESCSKKSGTLRDLLENYLVQLLCLAAMEPPSKFIGYQGRVEKLHVLRALSPITHDNFDNSVKLGQYEKGSVQATPVPPYADDVGRTAGTETFAALRCGISNWRWSGVLFFWTGKRLASRASEIVVIFKHSPHNIFENRVRGLDVMEPNRLVIRL